MKNYNISFHTAVPKLNTAAPNLRHQLPRLTGAAPKLRHQLPNLRQQLQAPTASTPKLMALALKLMAAPKALTVPPSSCVTEWHLRHFSLTAPKLHVERHMKNLLTYGASSQDHMLNGILWRHFSLTTPKLPAERHLMNNLLPYGPMPYVERHLWRYFSLTTPPKRHFFNSCLCHIRTAPMENPLSFRHLCQLQNDTHYCNNTFSTYNSACLQ
ncbi:unnamed protein product [Prunus brigantina]